MTLVFQWFAFFVPAQQCLFTLFCFLLVPFYFWPALREKCKGLSKLKVIYMLTTEKNCYMQVGQYSLICFKKTKKVKFILEVGQC